jgi:UDP-glucose 4-epimerase
LERVVVIGGAGFIGSHVADELGRRGYQVTIFDTVAPCWNCENTELVIGDMMDEKLLTDTISNTKYLYHFGGIADISKARDDPLETIRINVMGAAVVLDAARKANIKRLIYASTMYVYSAYGSFYRASKQAAETLIEAYQQQFGIEYTLLRYGSLYGPRAQQWNGLRRYVSQVVKENRLDYDGTGVERREYIHVLDAARLSVDILNDHHANQAIVVTGSQVLSSAELADMIFEIGGIDKNIHFTGNDREGVHYKMTPYRYIPKQAKKITPLEFIDIGQGILELFDEIHKESER